ncbi:MAG: hypothetical protein HY026_02730 [Deltaproteobacteria bacterium]|nr:hypothetical protein [Deltaproteobacteria bacterium]
MENEKLIERGIYLAQNRHFEEAIRVFEEDLCFAQHPVAMSFYALCIAEVEWNYDKAVSLCLMAAQRESYSPEIYLNFGKILLLNGQKTVAVKSFKKGLKFDKMHQGLLHAIKKLGLRRKPIISFLPRHNFINKFLGKLTHRLGYKELSPAHYPRS